MDQDSLKAAVAQAALELVEPMLEADSIIGIGTGSTTNLFIAALGSIAHRFDGAVASSEASAERLRSAGIPVYDLNSVGRLAVYVDGADECNHALELIKGGGAALTREKIVAADPEVILMDEPCSALDPIATATVEKLINELREEDAISYFTEKDANERIFIDTSTVSTWDLLEGAIAVYTVSSQMGFEAILAGHRPVVFGQPFFASALTQVVYSDEAPLVSGAVSAVMMLMSQN